MMTGRRIGLGVSGVSGSAFARAARAAATRVCACGLGVWLVLGCSSAKDDAVAGPTEPPRNTGAAASTASTSGSAAPRLDASTPPPTGSDQPQRDAQPTEADAAAADAGSADAATLPPAAVVCAPRPIAGDAQLHFHHVHFNTRHADQDLEFYEKLFATETIEWCKDAKSGAATWATKTDRGYFLYSEVGVAPDPTLNTYLEHVGWIHPNPNMELMRLVALDAPLFPEIRFQCPEAFAGQMACGLDGYWFYLQAPSGARIEVAKGPGPATMGFGHVHMITGVDFAWIETVTNGAFHDGAIDMVNHTAISLDESILDTEMVVETRGKPIDHVAYSTTKLEAERDRILAAGIPLAEDITFKPQFGFRSFMLKDSKGIWYEIVEDSPFSL